MRRALLARLIATAVAASSASTCAFAFEDAATGFAVKPQRPFTVTPIQDSRFDVGVGVDAGGSPPVAGTSGHLCKAGFKAAPQNAGHSQAELNAFTGKAEWLNMVKSTLAFAFDVRAIRNARIGDVIGAEVEAVPKMGPGAADTRVYMTIHETPKGRVTLACATTAKAWKGALLSFRAIRNAMTLPK
jgi:hypothetical protein